jgi:hypothetical protein
MEESYEKIAQVHPNYGGVVVAYCDKEELSVLKKACHFGPYGKLPAHA